MQMRTTPLSPVGGDGFFNRHDGRQLFVPNRHQFRRTIREDGGIRQHGADDLSDTMNLPTRTWDGGGGGCDQCHENTEGGKQGGGSVQGWGGDNASVMVTAM